MDSIRKKPWSISQFEMYRAYMARWVRHVLVPIIEDDMTTIIGVYAPVKSGKREIVEYIAKRDESIGSMRKHVFISAWHRKADDNQRQELELHNMKVFSITNKPYADACIKYIREETDKGIQIILHIDECDFGAGSKQILSNVYKYARNNELVLPILYSATIEEYLFSKEIDDEIEEMHDDLLRGTHVEYIPPPEYCGPARFLSEGLVHNAMPFFTMKPGPALTEQGKQFIQELKISTSSGSGRNISILRLTGGDGSKKDNKWIHMFLQNTSKMPELEDVHIWIDNDDYDERDERCKNIHWSNRNDWKTIAKDVSILIVIDQKASRSTEFAFHDRLSSIHDYRTNASYATISQAQERVNHYETTYNGFQPIKVYGHKATFELSAGLIDYNTYVGDHEWHMRKVDARRAEREQLGNVYEIKNKEGELHTDYQSPLLKSDAEDILKGIGCFYDCTISSRVKGKPRKSPIIETEWFACNSDTFMDYMSHIIPRILNGKFITWRYRNPFSGYNHRPNPQEDGREYGYLRNWGVFDYDTDVKTQPGWGVRQNTPRLTICYYQDVLGVAIRWHTGEFKEINLLNTYRSMYPSK